MLEDFNFRVILEYMPLYLQCFLATLWLSALSLVGAILVGITACSMRLSQSKVISRIAGIYIETIRAHLCWCSSIFSISVFHPWE